MSMTSYRQMKVPDFSFEPVSKQPDKICMIDQWAVPKKSEALRLANSETDVFIYKGVSQ